MALIESISNMIDATHWDRLVGMAPGDVARRAQAGYDEAAGEYALRLLTDELRVSPARRAVRWADATRAGEKPPGFHYWLVAVTYLLTAREQAPTGAWTTVESFPYGEFFFRGPHALPTQAVADAYGDCPERFDDSARRLGGLPWPAATHAFQLPALPRVPVLAQLWERDDEFPARAGYLFDRSACRHLAVDALFSLSIIITGRLVRNASPGLPKT